ncbi:Uu.00g122370.m01.CDS01 [Anthostomella pinea]|uniref:Uu.00g122370.m01.CDS01 n=1 Tax=Anthostomella pinea TaxID=933095 RepID=A0AAI8YEZ9_9PEZI|nr:Uu.00g122370.m01.CDS01 [Anthostomella pinea]
MSDRVSNGSGGAHNREFYEEARKRRDASVARGQDPYADFKELVGKEGSDSRLERAWRRVMDDQEDKRQQEGYMDASKELGRDMDGRTESRNSQNESTSGTATRKNNRLEGAAAEGQQVPNHAVFAGRIKTAMPLWLNHQEQPRDAQTYNSPPIQRPRKSV